MKIAMCSPEMVPFAKTGGLGDVVGALPRALRSLGADVFVMIPGYASIDRSEFRVGRIGKLPVPVGRTVVEAVLKECFAVPDVPVLLLEGGDYFSREGLYGDEHGDYPDNAERFAFLARGFLETLKLLDFAPDIVHCHDWQTGLVPVYLRTLYSHDPFFSPIRSLFTVHNLAYQGLFPPETLEQVGLDSSLFTPDQLEFWGKMSFMKGGLVFSDKISTVSPTYAREIQTLEAGCGLDGVLSARRQDLEGILNGIDPLEWNPTTDRALKQQYDRRATRGKLANKVALQRKTRLKVDESVPLIGLISRLVEQKGIDLIAHAADDLLGKRDVQLVILGTGDPRYHKLLEGLAKKYRKRLSLNIRFDLTLARQIYGGSDFFLMPSRFEPCGLGQMISFRYGTIPIVRRTGGFVDTIVDYNQATGEGNGFVFEAYTPAALLSAIDRALEAYGDKRKWRSLVQRVMALDFSWNASARNYLALYESLTKVAQPQPVA